MQTKLKLKYYLFRHCFYVQNRACNREKNWQNETQLYYTGSLVYQYDRISVIAPKYYLFTGYCLNYTDNGDIVLILFAVASYITSHCTSYRMFYTWTYALYRSYTVT